MTGASVQGRVRGSDEDDDRRHATATDGRVQDDVDDESGLMLAGYAARSWLRGRMLVLSHAMVVTMSMCSCV